MSTLIGAIVGLVVGILANGIFLYFVRLRPPRITISPVLALVPGDNSLHVKIRNETRRNVVNVQGRLSLIKREGILLEVVKVFKLVQPAYLGMGGIHTATVPWALPYALTFRTESIPNIENLTQQVDDGGCRLVFTVSVSDASTGTTAITRKTYTRACIERGKFGKGFSIIEHAGNESSGAEPKAE